MRVLFRPEARDDVVQARDWYENGVILACSVTA